jgi:predicted DNA-binding transcriptional regulator AlpA
MGTIHAATYKVDVNAIMGGQTSSQTDTDSYFLDFRGLATKLGTSEQWVRRNVRRTYTRDPIPHLRFGRWIRFVWDSPEMQEWIERRKTTTGGAKSLSADVRPASYNGIRTEFEPKRKERMQ